MEFTHTKVLVIIDYRAKFSHYHAVFTKSYSIVYNKVNRVFISHLKPVDAKKKNTLCCRTAIRTCLFHYFISQNAYIVEDDFLIEAVFIVFNSHVFLNCIMLFISTMINFLFNI